MRVVLAGNLANHSYFLAKLLRNHKIDAELLLKKNPISTEDPMLLDKELKSYPKWIKFWGKKNWKYQIVKLMRQYDVIHASTELPIFANFSMRPFIAQVTGADIAKLAREKSLKGILLNIAYKRAKIVIFPAPHYYKYVKKLKLKNAIFLPMLWDYEQFKPQIQKSQSSKTFLIFHPTNQNWGYKKNFIFLMAFKKLAKKYDNIHLITIDRGPDKNKMKKLLNESYLKTKITILPETLAQAELIDYYNKADVIVDQFGVGSSGLIGQEAMSCEKPLIQYLDKELYKKFYSEIPPILNSKTEEEVYSNIERLIKNPDLGIEIGKRSREWIIHHHNHEKIIKKYAYLYNSIISKVKFKEIQKTINSM